MRKVTICACASRTFIDKEKVAQLAAAAKQAGMEVTVVGDLCELCEVKDDSVHEIARSTIVACHTRAVKSLMAFAGETVGDSIDLRSGSLADVLKALGIDDKVDDDGDALIRAMREEIAAFPSKPGEDAWYPTLDKEACGVYALVKDRVAVVEPQHCKNNCPACARQCPVSAIIFPKYDRSPINGGAEMEERAVRLDSRELYGEVLRRRLVERKTRIIRN